MDYDSPAANAQAILRRNYFCDGHADTLALVALKGYDLAAPEPAGHLSLPRLQQIDQNLQFLAIFVDPSVHGYRGFLEALTVASAAHRLELPLVRSRADLERSRRSSRPQFLLSLEGAGPLQGDLGRLEILFHLGLRAVGLTHNHDNQAAAGCGSPMAPPPAGFRGLRPFGRRLIARMHELGMVVDVAHLARKAFYQVLEVASRPVINSHTCCARFVDIERNLDDAQLRALASTGGLAAVTYVPRFLKSEGPVTSEDVLRHLEHMVELMGVDHVALGSDFDGVSELPTDLGHPGQVVNLVERMLRSGWREPDIARVLGGNWLRVLRQVLPQE
ncbi:membrane dipeptidase [bacterium CPR1]|nr:membrane dipeptidase [bacterium CPR1]